MSTTTFDIDILGNACRCNSHSVVTGIRKDKIIFQCSKCQFTIARSISSIESDNISLFRLFLLNNFMTRNCEGSQRKRNNIRTFTPIIEEVNEKITIGDWSE